MFIAPKVECCTVGNCKGCQCTKYRYAPAALDAFQKVAGVFFKPQCKHNGNNAQLGKVDDKQRHLGGQNTQIDQGGTQKKIPENRSQSGAMSNKRGDKYAAPNNGQDA